MEGYPETTMDLEGRGVVKGAEVATPCTPVGCAQKENSPRAHRKSALREDPGWGHGGRKELEQRGAF